MSTSENPLFIDDGERSPHRVLVGISRIKTYEKDIRVERAVMDWRDEHDLVRAISARVPEDGIGLPVQGHCGRGRGSEKRAPYLVALDGGIRTDFRYGSSRVTLDRAVAVCERAIVHSRAAVGGRARNKRRAELQWLSTILLELWEDRGPYPGMAPCWRRARLCARR